MGLRKHRADFLVRDPLARIALLAEQPEHQLAGHVQEPYKRRPDLGDQDHGRRHAGGDRFRSPQRDLLRHQLADDQRQIGDGDDNGADAQGIRPVVRQPLQFKPVGEPGTEGRAGEGAGKDADQGDADLDR